MNTWIKRNMRENFLPRRHSRTCAVWVRWGQRSTTSRLVEPLHNKRTTHWWEGHSGNGGAEQTDELLEEWGYQAETTPNSSFWIDKSLDESCFGTKALSFSRDGSSLSKIVCCLALTIRLSGREIPTDGRGGARHSDFRCSTLDGSEKDYTYQRPHTI